jgi:5-methylcytosine-specific restriction endonuclease McrA
MRPAIIDAYRPQLPETLPSVRKLEVVSLLPHQLRCLCCGDLKVTKDHIIPRWLGDYAHFTGYRYLRELSAKNNIQPLCETCNRKKSGKLDWHNELTREFMRAFALFILDQLDAHAKY